MSADEQKLADKLVEIEEITNRAEKKFQLSKKLKVMKSKVVPSVPVPVLTNKCAIKKGDVLKAQLASFMPKRKVDGESAAEAKKRKTR